MNIRDKRQKAAIDAIVNNRFTGILNISPRFGKSKVVIEALKKIKKDPKVLIIAPYNQILKSWNEEFKKWNLTKKVDLINQRSIDKIKDINYYQLIICDECHTLSERQLETLISFKGRILGLSGSISKDTEKKLNQALDLSVIHEYTVDEAVDDKIVADYEVKIITLPLDNKTKYIKAGSKTKPFLTTEEANYRYLTKRFIQAAAIVKKDKSKEPWLKSILGQRARAVYSYQSKIDLTKKLLNKIKERTLVFTTLTTNDIVKDKHDSKSDGTNLQRFVSGEIDKLQVCNMVSMGKVMPL